jgi:hypothetical protein
MRDGGIVNEWLAFDIERHITWDRDYSLQPFAYSMMIDGFYPVARPHLLFGQSRPTIEDFSLAAAGLPGFVLDKEITLARNGLLTYRNPGRNLLINWSETDRICIGVIQQSPVLQLEVVTEEIVPYATEVFNHLNPTGKNRGGNY